ncbi:unnamed protein product, partial [Prorocentrum cordatum]
ALLANHDVPAVVAAYPESIGMQKMDDLAVHLDARSEDQARCYSNVTMLYMFSLRTFERCSDSMFGRLCREANKWTMTFCQVDKIRDLKQSQAASRSKRTRFAENLVLD